PVSSSAGSPSPRVRAPPITCAPASTKALVIANPMPLLAPVTTAVLPDRCRSIYAPQPAPAGTTLLQSNRYDRRLREAPSRRARRLLRVGSRGAALAFQRGRRCALRAGCFGSLGQPDAAASRFGDSEPSSGVRLWRPIGRHARRGRHSIRRRPRRLGRARILRPSVAAIATFVA